jgi:tetratricopeptide (TPR) repeat protein
MTCPHCGTDTPAGAARCAGCGAPQAPADVTMPVDLDVTGGLPDAGAFETMGSGAPAAGTGTHQLDIDVTRITAPQPTRTSASSRGGPTPGIPRQFQMLTPGETLGVRYHIIRLLGVGGMGAVYHAWDAELGVAVALKVIRGDITGDPGAAADIERQFKRELLLARQVTHKHVVRIHDLGDIDGIKYITMPYVQGSDLASVLKESGTLPVPRTLRYISQVVGGLVAAHEAGVVHRDLKPANIMIDEDDQALIMDFGIAHSSGGTGNGTGKVVGTLAYMAPEQAQAQVTDQRADVYALGMMLREMLVGKKPGGDGQQALADLMQRIKEAPAPLRTLDETIPEPLSALAAKCVEPDPANRFQTSAELAAALAALDEDGNLRPVEKPILSPWRMTVAAVVVVATIGAAAVVWRRTVPAAAPKPIDPVSILVADFDNRTGDAVFDGALEQSLTIAMEGASFITSYSRPGALKLAQTLGNATRLDAASARPVAFRENVKYVLAGSVASAGSKFQLQVDALDPATGKAVKSATVTAANKDDVLPAVVRLASKIRTGLGDTASDAVKLAAAETFTAGSIDAMREYSIAQDLQNGGKADQALAHYLRAIELDPKFGRAYSGAANINFRLGHQAEADALFKQALSLMNRMTDREKHRTLGAYYMQITGNYEKSVEEYTALLNAYPADIGGRNNLAVDYFYLHDFAKAVREGQRVLETYPNSVISKNNLALYSMYASDFAGGAKLATAVVAADPTVFKAHLPIAVDAILKGDAAAATAAYDEMAKVNALGASLASTGRADLALYAGRNSAAVAELKTGIAADLAGKNTLNAALKHVAAAEGELAAGRRAQAADEAHEALKVMRRVETLVPAARVLLRAGKAAEARTIAAELEDQVQKQNRAYGKIVLAEIALEEKKTAEAIDLLTQARALADLWLGRFDMGVAYIQKELYAEAQPELEACLKRRGEATALFFDDTPTVRYLAALPYWMGRAEEGLNISTASSRYQTFLEIRKDATADPLVQDARRRLAGR